MGSRQPHLASPVDFGNYLLPKVVLLTWGLCPGACVLSWHLLYLGGDSPAGLCKDAIDQFLVPGSVSL